MKKKITIAEEAGFCFGVERAAESVEDLIKQGKKTVTLGPLIHNKQVVKRFENQGVIVSEKLEDIPKGYTAVIRSHGVPKETVEFLENNQIDYINATCPYVLKIHNIVKRASDEGKIVLVLGDESHPEIVGVLSYCDNWKCFANSDDLHSFMNSHEFSSEKEYILIAQTTFREEEWEKCREFTNNPYTNVHIFDTICRATMLRQKAVVELAQKSDCMIVIGGRNSSNTNKLASVSQQYCRTHHIETADELMDFDFSDCKDIGVTAGASTPAFIIKEVLNSMSDVVNNKEEMSFEEMLDESFKTVSTRDRVTAVVTSVAPNEIAVDIGTKHAGYVPLFEYTDDPNADLEALVKPGDEIELLVLRLNDAEGTALLSKKRLDAIAGFEKIVEAEEADETLKGTVVDVVKGGVIALTNGVRVFIPASQSSLYRGQDLEALRGKEVSYKILETNRNRRRAVGSIRAVLQEERAELAEKFWDDVEVGEEREGVVKSLTNYGAFVDLGGVDGMIHISEISWSRIKHPSDVLAVGDEIEVTVKDVDKEEQKVSLSYKKDENNPWNILKRDYTVGDVVPAKIVSMTSFGAFAQVIPGVDGLIHISQISHDRIEKPSDVLAIGEVVQVAITEIDFDRKRVSLSIRALLEDDRDKEILGAAAPKVEADEEVVAQFGPPEEETSAKEKIKEKAEDAVDKAKEISEDIAEKAEEVAEDAEEKAEELKEKAEELEDKAEEKAEEVIEKAEETAKKAKEKAKEVKEKSEEKLKEIKDKIEDKAEELEEKIEDLIDDSDDDEDKED